MSNVQYVIGISKQYESYVVAHVLAFNGKIMVFFVGRRDTHIMWFTDDVFVTSRTCTRVAAKAAYRQALGKGYVLSE